MPMGLDTLLTDADRALSSGVVQRLLIARALLQRPAILILDQATSGLDNVTQERVMRAVRRLAATLIVIAHRLSTIERADRIVVLAGGRIVEEGSHQELLERNGAYAGLYHLQYGGEIPA
jgi:subfamily B ATP-binding cassette protein MsbA